MGGKQFDYTTAAPGELAPPVERDNPREVVVGMTREIASWVSGAVTVLLWLTGGLVGAMGWLSPPWPVVLFAPLIVGVAVFIWLFVQLSQRRMLRHFEERYRVDIDRDGYIGTPPPQTVRLEITSRAGTRTSLWDTGVPLETARRFATAALRGDTSVRAMDAARVSRDDVEKIRQALFEYGWARWKNGYSNQGWELTDEGADVMRAVQSAKSFPTPPG